MFYSDVFSLLHPSEILRVIPKEKPQRYFGVQTPGITGALQGITRELLGN